jgi:hypothetical protein
LDAIDKELGGIDYYNEQRVTFPDLEGRLRHRRYRRQSQRTGLVVLGLEVRLAV